MSVAITSCSQCPDWIDRALSRVAQFEEFDDENFGVEIAQDTKSIEDEANEAIGAYRTRAKIEREKTEQEAIQAAKKAELSSQLIDPGAWGKGGKRPIAVNPSAKRKAQKTIHEIAKGRHKSIPIEEIFDAMIVQGLVPIQEDGYMWQGFITGRHECGTEEARSQMMTLPLVSKNADGKWCLTTTYMHMSWCEKGNGYLEIVCYLS